ncbi:hypothetical protein MTO96_009752 [Rhipicephalus appendiculatus]
MLRRYGIQQVLDCTPSRERTNDSKQERARLSSALPPEFRKHAEDHRFRVTSAGRRRTVALFVAQSSRRQFGTEDCRLSTYCIELALYKWIAEHEKCGKVLTPKSQFRGGRGRDREKLLDDFDLGVLRGVVNNSY